MYLAFINVQNTVCKLPGIMKQVLGFSEAWDLIRERKAYGKEPGNNQMGSFRYVFLSLHYL
jgi:hypothetical protein